MQVIDVVHPNRAPVAKQDLKKELVKVLKGSKVENMFLFGFKVAYGGGRSSGFGLCYDSMEDALRFEPRHRLLRVGLGQEKTRTRKQWKDLKKKKAKTWGTGRRAAKRKQKRAAEA